MPGGVPKLALAAALVAASASCVFVVPRTRATTVATSEERTGVTLAGAPVLEVAAEARGDAVVVAATWRRTCDVARVQVREVRRRKRLGLWWASPCGGGGDCGTATAIAIVFAPATLLVSALVAVPVVVASRPRTARETSPRLPERVACDLPADGVRVRVVAPGRPDAPATTGADGRAEVPLGDPAAAAAAAVHVDDPAGVAPVRAAGR